MSTNQACRALLLNGTVGVGKTSVAQGVGARLRARGLPGVVVDLDGLRDAWPSPSGDPFHLELTLRNLAAVARHAVQAGSRYVVLAGVVESRSERLRYADALAMPLTLYRLRADLDVVAERLVHRHVGDPDGVDWHLRRSIELDQILDRAHGDDVVLDASCAPVGELAEDVLARWLHE